MFIPARDNMGPNAFNTASSGDPMTHTILRLDASARHDGSLSRAFADAVAAGWYRRRTN